MWRGRKVCLLVALLLLSLTACSNQKFISKDPTDYTLGTGDGTGRTKTSYLTAEHPDVQLVIPLVEQFLGIDQTQDYNKLNWDELVPLAEDRLITERHDKESKTLIEHTIIKHLHDCQVQRIVFLGKDIDKATVTVELSVVYTNVGERYAAWHDIKLNEPSPIEAQLDLRKKEGKWLVCTTSYTHLTS